MRKLFLTLLLCAPLTHALADEGMWMLTDLKRQNEAAMQELGLLLPADSIYNPESIALKDAVVHFGGAQPSRGRPCLKGADPWHGLDFTP